MKREQGIVQRQGEEPAFAKASASKGSEELVQAKLAGGGLTASPTLESRLSSRKGQGQPLPEEARQSMSQAFDTDFSGVKVHTDGEAVQMNRELGAKAFTHGSDIYFNQGEYNPASAEGKRLLGHELTHTIQQGGIAIHQIQRQTEDELKSALEHDDKVQEALANPIITSALGKLEPLGVDAEAERVEEASDAAKILERFLGERIRKELGLGDKPFAALENNDKAAVAFVIGMLMWRQEYIDKYSAYILSSSKAILKNEPMNIKNNLLDDSNKAANRGLIEDLVVFNPDTPLLLKEQLLGELKSYFNEDVKTILYSSATHDKMREIIKKKAQLFYDAIGGSGKMPDTFLGALGDKGHSSGLLSSRMTVNVRATAYCCVALDGRPLP